MDVLNRFLILALLLFLLYGVYTYQQQQQGEYDDSQSNNLIVNEQDTNSEDDINIDNISQYSIGSLGSSFMDDGTNLTNDLF